jgi:hypothetical protein
MLFMLLQPPKQAMCSKQGHIPCCLRRLQQAICRPLTMLSIALQPPQQVLFSHAWPGTGQAADT